MPKKVSQEIQMPKIHEEVQKHLLETCRELKEWRNTGQLANGKIREIANKFADDRISLVEYAITEAAVQKTIETLS